MCMSHDDTLSIFTYDFIIKINRTFHVPDSSMYLYHDATFLNAVNDVFEPINSFTQTSWSLN